MRTLIGVLLLAPLGAGVSAQEKVTFQDIWSRAKTQGRSRAAALDVRASVAARERADRHIYPRVYLDARGYNTNDPTQSFMSVLSLRSAQLTDFLPERLNNPSSSTVARGTMGIDLSLYEGGAKAAQAKVQRHLQTSREEEFSSTLGEEYVAALSMYAALITIEDAERRLQSLEAQLNETLGRYQLGSASNPVGYSGLLGLRSLKNRVAGLKLMLQTRIDAARNTLEAMAPGLPVGWTHQDNTLIALLDENAAASDALSVSHRTRALEAQARMKESLIDMESARSLPRVGVFTEASGFAGKAKTASSYNVGFYVTMVLSAQEIGAGKQASLESQAMAARALDFRLREEAEGRTLNSARQSLEKSMVLLLESEKLLDEQLRTARELYRSGSINLMQYTEVLSRRVDLIEQRIALSSDYTKVRTGLYLLSADPAASLSEASK